MADKGKEEDKKAEEASDDSETESATAETDAPEPAVHEASEAPAPVAPEAVPAPVPASVQPPAESPAAAPAQPEAVPEAPPLTTEQAAAARTALQAGFSQDLSAGTIKPETYHDLYEKKSTLGKLGTIFGLMLSGAGSALAHQPNALLEMMNKEIERDVEAQKQNQTNKQNWYKMALEHERNIAQNGLVSAQTREAAAKADFQNMINEKNGVTQKAATNDAANYATMGYLQTQQNNINLMSPGPQRDQAQALLDNMIKPAALKAISERNLQTEGLKKVVGAANPPPRQKGGAQGKDSEPSHDVVDLNKYRKMISSGDLKHRYGGVLDPKTDIDPSEKHEIDGAITKMTRNYNNYKDVMEAYEALAAMPNAGEAPLSQLSNVVKKIPWIGETLAAGLHAGEGKLERPRDQLLDSLAQRLSAHGASTQTIEEMKKALSPSMYDSPETLKKGAELVYQHFAHNDEANPGVLEKYPGLKKNLKKIEFHGPKETPRTKEEPSPWSFKSRKE